MGFKHLLKPLGMVLAPSAVGIGGGGTGLWWLLDSERKSLQDELDQRTSQIQEIEVVQTAFENEKHRIARELEEAIKNKDLNSEAIGFLDAKLKELVKDRESLQSEESGLNDEIESLNDEQRSSYAEIKEKQKDLNEDLAELARKSILLEIRTSQINDLKRYRNKLEARIEVLKKQKQDSTENSLELDARLKVLKDTIVQLESQNEKLTEERDSYQAVVDSKKKKVEEQEERVKDQNKGINVVVISLAKKVRENSEKRAANEEIKREISRKIEQLGVDNIEIGKKYLTLLKQQQNLAAQSAENEEVANQILSMSKETQKNLDELFNLEEQVLELKKNLAAEEEDLFDKDRELKNRQQKEVLDGSKAVVQERFIKEQEAAIRELKERSDRISRQIKDSYGSILASRESYDLSEKINIREIVHTGKGYTNDQAKFKAIYEGETVEFKFKKPTSFELEKALSDVKKTGLQFDLSGSATNWNGKFKLKINKLLWRTTSDFSLIVETSNEEEEIDILKIFKEEHKQEAMKVLIAIKLLQKVMFKFDAGDQSFELSSSDGLSSLFSKEGVASKEQLTDGWEPMNVHSFKTKNDFIKYWIIKTFEQVKNKSVDFSEIFNPALKEASYNG